jgi:TRAP-type C4-dicarboxylate transport system permease small subunit
MTQSNPKHLLERIRGFLNRFEDGILAGLLISMMTIAVMQILLRNLFETGIVWGDAMLRMLVLWVGLIGAMVASRLDNHIRIDLVSRFLPKRLGGIAKFIAGCFTSICCGVFAYYSLQFVRFEFEDGGIAFAKIPVWICASIIPLAFFVIALRSFASALIHFAHSETSSP